MFVVQKNNVSASVNGLRALLQNNVVELKFIRRDISPGRSRSRRMLSTLDFQLLNSEIGKQIFRFSSPSKFPSYNASSYNLLTVYDLFMLDWRNIPADSCQIINVIPTTPQVEFWDYFNNILSKMSASQKAAFMDK